MSMRVSVGVAGRVLGQVLGLALLLTLLSMPAAFAITLDQAKQQGMVCELPTGYLKATSGATADVERLINTINSKRKQEYARIAGEHGVTPEQVGKLTAQKLSPRCK